jgi:hypothetical protein
MMKINDYFSLDAIRRRVNQQTRQQFILTLNILLSLVIVVVMIAIIQDVFPLPSNRFTERATEIHQLLERLAFFTVFFGVLLIHRVWLKRQIKNDQEIDEAVRAQCDAERYREEYGDYLSHDGELTYNVEESEYDLKPKRKQM